MLFGLFLTARAVPAVIMHAARLRGGLGTYVRGASWWLVPSAALVVGALWLTLKILAD